ncbi:MAG: aminopeptidase N, partial [Acidobacteria bacterium]|nr:aminopeptidase N [Acidobacteriota bacterium]
AIFEVTKSGLTFFNTLFDYPYPFGKYDQAFVPEYNLGAMENPGLVTFTEAYVFTSRATNTQYQGRANTIMHEMAHMWFGDLVTMRWWDDLWLKESFADYMGHLGVAQATQWGEQSWIQFADSRKSWAYLQDQLPTTHPIVADIVDLEAAKQNFDGITYAKGASALKQLVAYVGFEEFIAGARKYFRAHEFGNTTLPDLLAALGEASGRDLGRWSKAWLETSGPSTLSTKISADDGVITDVQILASSVDPVSGNEVDRPHRVRVGAYNFDSEGSLNRVKSVEVDVSGTSTRVPELNGMPRPALLLINDEDLSYAKIVLEDVSVNTAITSLSSVADPMARALVWSALWSQTRDGAMPAARFVAAVVAHAPAEENVGTLSNLLASARTAVLRYTSAAERAELIATLLGAIVQQLRAAAPGSDTQLVWARNLALLSRSTDGAQGLIRDILAGTSSLSGLTVDSALRWLFLQALAATGGVDTEALAQELAADTTAPGHVGHRLAMSALPTDAAKAAAWEAALRDTKISNELLSATIEGFNLGPASLRTAYGEPYFREIEHVWSSQSIELASRIVRGLYPMDANLEQNYRPDEHPDILRSQAWLDAHGEAPAGLRRIIIEAQDHLLRALSAQQAAWRM